MNWRDYVDDERALRRAAECELMDTRAERDRLRRELEALRARLLADMPGNWDAAAGDCCPDCYAGWDAAIEGIGAILRGEP